MRKREFELWKKKEGISFAMNAEETVRFAEYVTGNEKKLKALSKEQSKKIKEEEANFVRPFLGPDDYTDFKNVSTLLDWET